MPTPFTDTARRVADRAAAQAGRLGQDYIGTEHVLLSLLDDHEEVAASVLAGLGIAPGEVRTRVEQAIGRGPHALAGEPRPWTPRAHRILTLARREARRLGAAHVAAEHLLLGTIRETEGIAAEVLISLGAELHRMRHHVRTLRAPGGDAAHHPGDGDTKHRNLQGPFRSRLWGMLDALHL
jgi:ATP-dependent Clp protease ATP-binding subunit ClpC